MASGGEVKRVEVQLVQAAAADLKTKIAWVSGSESELLGSLHERQLDLVIGGLSRSSPWKHQVAFSRPTTSIPPLSPLLPGSARAR
jgi:polar amino acid transport system substrate-binding protein